MTSKIPRDATELSMTYSLYYSISIDEDINREDIVDWWVKWATLCIKMKDGTVHELEGDYNLEGVDWKNGHMDLRWLDDDYNTLKEKEE